MPTKPPHHVSSQLLRISHFLRILSRPTLILRDEPKKKHRPPQAGLHQFNPPVSPAGYPSLPRSIARTPFTRNEPNFSIPSVPPPPIYAKRTLRTIARRRRASTNITPRFHRRGTPAYPDQSPTTQKYETNPIYTPHTPKYAKRTQFHPPQDPNARNEPNPSQPRWPKVSPDAHRETQSTNYEPPTTIQICETNPISAPNRPPHDPKIRNEPNSTPPTAKSKQPTAKKCETNPISGAPDKNTKGLMLLK